MKKLLMKGKGFLAVFVLSLMVVGMISSVTQASIKKTGTRKHTTAKGYWSHTEVMAYDDKGYALNIIVYAGIGSKQTYVYDSGFGTADSASISAKKNASHGYAIGHNKDKDLDVIWLQN